MARAIDVIEGIAWPDGIDVLFGSRGDLRRFRRANPRVRVVVTERIHDSFCEANPPGSPCDCDPELVVRVRRARRAAARA